MSDEYLIILYYILKKTLDLISQLFSEMKKTLGKQNYQIAHAHVSF